VNLLRLLREDISDDFYLVGDGGGGACLSVSGEGRKRQKGGEGEHADHEVRGHETPYVLSAKRGPNAEWLEMVVARVEHRGGGLSNEFARGRRWLLSKAAFNVFVIGCRLIRADKFGCDRLHITVILSATTYGGDDRNLRSG
jgi:hypothetical protein